MKKISTIRTLLLLVLASALSTVAYADTPVNLIPNASFETAGTDGNPTSWSRGGYGDNIGVFTYPSVGADGNKAVKTEITSYRDGDAKWYFTDVPVTGGNVYTLKESYKSNVATKIGLRYQTSSGVQHQLLATVPASNDWMTFTRSITVPTNATALTVFHVIATVGALETDMFSLIRDTATLQTPPLTSSDNLFQNPTFETIGTTGDPVGWLRGGYGDNTRDYNLDPCPYYTKTDTVQTNSNAFRPQCPPETKYKLRVSIVDYINGDAKWYFSDIKIGTKKNFTLSYQYQAYTGCTLARALARYTLQDGSYQYVVIGDMPQPGAGGQGYIAWINATHQFTAPNKATSVTVFFTIDGKVTPVCGPGGSTLSIANPVLR